MEVELKTIPQGHRRTPLKSCAIGTRCFDHRLRFMLDPCPSILRVFQGTYKILKELYIKTLGSTNIFNFPSGIDIDD